MAHSWPAMKREVPRGSAVALACVRSQHHGQSHTLGLWRKVGRTTGRVFAPESLARGRPLLALPRLPPDVAPRSPPPWLGSLARKAPFVVPAACLSSWNRRSKDSRSTRICADSVANRPGTVKAMPPLAADGNRRSCAAYDLPLDGFPGHDRVLDYRARCCLHARRRHGRVWRLREIEPAAPGRWLPTDGTSSCLSQPCGHGRTGRTRR